MGQQRGTPRGVPWDSKEAAKWYRLAAEQGHTKAQIMLGHMYARGEGVPEDYQEAVKWYQPCPHILPWPWSAMGQQRARSGIARPPRLETLMLTSSWV